MQANVNSRTHAIGWTGLFNGFAGTGEKADWQNMLPFPDAVETQKVDKLSGSTIAAMKRAIESRKIKPQMLSAMMEVSDEVAKFAQSVL